MRTHLAVVAALLLAPLAPVTSAAVAPSPRVEDGTPLATTISEVVVYGGSARVRRSGTLPGGGVFLLAGLPGGLDADNVRVRLSTGSVVGVEVIDRVQRIVPDERVQALRAKVEAIGQQIRASEDERAVGQTAQKHLSSLLAQEESSHRDELAAGRPNAEAWKASLEFVIGELGRVNTALREVDLKLAALRSQLKDAQAELGPAESGEVRLKDVRIDTVTAAGASVDVEYFVNQAGWEPLYDLRTAADARSVDLVYRANVWQQTGEDWPQVALLLSTAQPQRGAQGPDPFAIRLRVQDKPKPGAPAAAMEMAKRGRRLAADESDFEDARLQELGYVAAGVESQGLSAQFRLPRRETIPSRQRPSNVLVGQHTLAVVPEHLVAPALDTTVWLRGRTTNSSPWIMLPGRASVYFGADFIGQAWFGAPVLPDQEFTLHLGADPGLAVERIRTDDLTEEPGLFSKRRSATEGWRIAIKNHGGHPAAADGSVTIIVREAIPLPADDRITVEVSGESHKASSDERWAAEAKEQGIRTWLVRVPKGGETSLSYKLVTSWPAEMDLIRDGGWLR